MDIDHTAKTAMQSYIDAVEQHKEKFAKKVTEYEDMVSQAANQLEELVANAEKQMAATSGEPQPEPEPPTVAKVTAETGEVFYAYNQAAHDQQQVIMDGMLDVIQSL